jgi:hypothetical protein
MTDPALVMAGMDADVQLLDTIGKQLDTATQALNVAEERWDIVLDTVTATLEEEYAEAGRKSVPEHTALSAARRTDRVAYAEWRRARREVERLQARRQTVSAALSGRQSQLGALRDEARAPVPQTSGPTYGARRAA